MSARERRTRRPGGSNRSLSRAASRPTTPGGQCSPADHHRRAALLEPEREQRLGLGLGQRRDLDLLAGAVEPVELGGDGARLDLVGGRQQPRAEGRVADPPAGIDARPDQKAEMIGPRRTVGAGDVEQGRQAPAGGAARMT